MLPLVKLDPTTVTKLLKVFYTTEYMKAIAALHKEDLPSISHAIENKKIN
jgi:hypothetical protein